MIAPDLNDAARVAKDTKNIDDLNLYYVACTRAKKDLVNANELGYMDVSARVAKIFE